MRRPPSRRAALAAAALLLLAAACGGDDDPAGLPDVEGARPPAAYRVRYEVTTPEGRGSEERVVRRPFQASVTERDVDGEVVAQRLSDLGLVVTIQAGETTAVQSAVAPPVGDLRPERFAARLVDAGRLEEGRPGEVGGRACRRLVEADEISRTDDATGDGAAGDGAALRPFPVLITRCVDAVGIVLEERIATPGGQALRTARAVELEVGGDVRPVDPPDVEPLAPDEGGGRFEELTGEAPGIVSWRIRPPSGFERVGAYVVEQPTVGADPAGGRLALVTEVWQRGPDLLLLDQGRATGSGTPFDPAAEVKQVDLPAGPAALAVDLRSAELRLRGADGGFVRVAGTLPLDELLEVARTLAPRT